MIAAESQPLPLDVALRQAIAHHQAGRLREAEQLYSMILQTQPNHPDANHNLGVLALQVKQAAASLPHFKVALEANPNQVQYWFSYIDALIQTGQTEAARQVVHEGRQHGLQGKAVEALAMRLEGGADTVAKLNVEHRDPLTDPLLVWSKIPLQSNSPTPQELVTLVTLFTEGRYAEAATLAEVMTERFPMYGIGWKVLGAASSHMGRNAVALTLMQKAVALLPNDAEAYSNLGNALNELGRLDEAETNCRRALAIKPDLGMAHNNLGNALKGLGRLDEAEASYRRAIEIKPDFAEAQGNLGNALKELGRLDEAEANHRRAIEIKPDFAIAHNNLGNTLRELDRLEEAEASYRRALEIKPDFAEAHNNLGNVLSVLGRLDESETSHQRAVEINPDFADARCAWVHQRQQLCTWSNLQQEVDALRSQVATDKSCCMSPFSFLALPDSTAFEQRNCALQFAEKTYLTFLSRQPLSARGLRRSRTKLRIGYLSADYFNHATSYLLAEVIERHDRKRFDIVAYSYGRNDEGPMRKRMRAAFDAFHDIRAIPNESAARHIFGDEIDILVDLKGYTTDTRIEITALRPAPVHVSWLGYPGTLGHLRLADYLIGDPIVTPLEHAAHYSETLALMPHCYQPNDRQRASGPAPSRKDAGLRENGFVFCCFNQSYKITPEMFDVWCRLLEAVPGSLLWLLKTYSTAEKNLRQEAQTRGVTPERIVFGPTLLLHEHLARLQLADLALDTYPVTSHTTASDALWVGVPLITRIGETFVSRVAASILHAAGLPELVTHDLESYYRLALELATNPERLRDTRAKLAANRMQCPLFDSERFTRDLERLYERIWSNYCAGKTEQIVLAD